MSAGVEVRERLLANAAVVALVGQRVYAVRAPQGCARPFVVFQVISEPPENSLTSGSGNLRNARVQVKSYAEGYIEAHALADAVEAALVDVQSSSFSALLLSSADDFEDEVELDLVRADFSVWVR